MQCYLSKPFSLGLLASEGGIGREFNMENFCLQINDEGKAIEEITDQIKKKVAHILLQT